MGNYSIVIFPCPDSVRCPSSENPLSNYSSEAPDPPIRLGYSTGTSPTSSFRGDGGGGPSSTPPDPPPDGQADTGTGGDPPLLDSTWDNAVVTTFVEVTDPTLDPNTVAGNQNVTQLTDGTGTPGSGGWLTPRGIPITVFINHPQTCIVNCPDGLPFQFTVPLGRFRALSQSDADRAAYSYACKQAALNALCLGSIGSAACVGQPYMQTILASTHNPPLNFSVLGYPAWVSVTINPTSIILSGTPESGDVAVSNITVFAVDSLGYTMSKDFQISVTNCTEPCMITESTLPAFDQGQFYTTQLHATGGTAPYTWQFLGALPLGLTLSSGGTISGIAELVNGNLDADFTVIVTDSSTPPKQCDKQILLPVLNYNNFPPGKHWRLKNYVDGSLNSTCCQVCVLCNVWDGSFTIPIGAAFFQGNNTAGIANRVTNMFLRRAFTGEWALQLYCSTNPGNAVWTGIKVRSNAGPKLDSPAGVYTFNNWFGYGTICDATLTLTIEEY